MKLIQLKCDNPLFKTINFNPRLSIVAGIQLSDSDRKTINGIGKSLSLELLHLMLGAKQSEKQKDSFIKFLANYGKFSLVFEHNNIKYTVNKNFNDQMYYLNGEEFRQSAYIKELDRIIINGKLPISFRTVFNAFARRYGYYDDALTQQHMGITDYNQRLVNFVLLGIDTDLVKQRHKTKEQINKLDDAKKIVSEYEKTMNTVNVSDLRDELNELNRKKNAFIIAKDYDEQKARADNLTYDMNTIRNEEFQLELSLRRKNVAIEESVYFEVDNQKIKEIFEEAKFHFPSSIVKNLNDVQSFHKTIVNNRKKKLEKEVVSIKTKIDILKKQLLPLEAERDEILKHLKQSGALEEYYSLLDRIKDLENKIQEAEKYKNIVNTFKRDKSQLEAVNTEIRAKSISFITDHQGELEEKEAIFRSIVKKFYSTSGGSLELVETNDANYLYDISLQIPKDKSQGIGEVKIFCYDVLLYLLNKDILNFMAHDGCLFSGMDPRQEAIIFKIVLELINKYHLQYFVNINQNSLKEILDSPILNAEEKKEISESVVLNLNDKKPKEWLFGASF